MLPDHALRVSRGPTSRSSLNAHDPARRRPRPRCAGAPGRRSSRTTRPRRPRSGSRRTPSCRSGTPGLDERGHVGPRCDGQLAAARVPGHAHDVAQELGVHRDVRLRWHVEHPVVGGHEQPDVRPHRGTRAGRAPRRAARARPSTGRTPTRACGRSSRARGRRGTRATAGRGLGQGRVDALRDGVGGDVRAPPRTFAVIPEVRYRVGPTTTGSTPSAGASLNTVLARTSPRGRRRPTRSAGSSPARLSGFTRCSRRPRARPAVVRSSGCSAPRPSSSEPAPQTLLRPGEPRACPARAASAPRPVRRPAPRPRNGRDGGRSVPPVRWCATTCRPQRRARRGNSAARRRGSRGVGGARYAGGHPTILPERSHGTHGSSRPARR